MKNLYSTCSQDFFIFESEEERKKHEKEISLTIVVDSEKIDLYNFVVIYQDDVAEFCYKHKLDDEGKPMVLYWFDNKCSGRFLDVFFQKCKEKGIIPLDITNPIKEALAERKSLQNAKRLNEEK